MTKVMVVGPTDPDSFADNVGDTLRRMGHQVHMAGPARRVVGNRRVANAAEIFAERMPSLDERVQRRLIGEARDFEPDVVLTVDRRIQPAIVRELRRGGARIALWFPDAVSNLGRHDLFLAPYDKLFFKNPRLVDQLNRVHGLPAVYMPEAANSSWHHSTAEYGSDRVVVVAGNIHPTRAILLERLIDVGLPLRIYGPRPASWMRFPGVNRAHTGRFISRTEKADVFRRARVVLNNLHPAEFAGSNCRLFEATASGAAVLTELREGLSDLFNIGEEVDVFGDFDELVEKCNRLLSDSSQGRTVGDRAAIRSHRDHTYEVRLATILTQVE
ncbi:hypothetical protein B4U78_010560 [Microbacterium esteraromaticum]|nr:hypothetical protein B4U78_010560 [Microbacterium esteraromaticum]